MTFWATDCSPSYCSCFLPAPPNHTQKSFWSVENTFSDHSCELHSGLPIVSFLLIMLLACTRRRHSRHAKPYPKALLPTAHASCLHPQAPQSACQTIPKSNFGASKTHFRITRGVTAFWATDCSPSSKTPFRIIRRV